MKLSWSNLYISSHKDRDIGQLKTRCDKDRDKLYFGVFIIETEKERIRREKVVGRERRKG